MLGIVLTDFDGTRCLVRLKLAIMRDMDIFFVTVLRMLGRELSRHHCITQAVAENIALHATTHLVFSALPPPEETR